MNTLHEFINDNESDMLTDLICLVKLLIPEVKANYNNYPPGSDNFDNKGEIDIRLCIDRADTRRGYGDTNVGYTWIFRYGDSSYDQRHSEYCAASCIGLKTNPKDLLNDLINQIGEYNGQ